MTIAKSLITRLSLVLPLLAVGFTAKIASAQPEETPEAANAKFTVLHSFYSQAGCPDGENASGGIVQATNGDLYGTTYLTGAANCNPSGCGTIFKITPSGALTTVYNFCPQADCTDAESPLSLLVQATNGYLYGTTPMIGNGLNCNPGACGTIFKMTPGGALTTLFTFCSPSVGCPDGGSPLWLVQAANGDFYGTSTIGGILNSSCLFGCGTVSKITPSGVVTTLYGFCPQPGCVDGGSPTGALVQATNGDLYGTTGQGGIYDPKCQCYGGTIFKITPTGTLTTLYRFCSQSGCPDGYNPMTLIRATNENSYTGQRQAGPVPSLVLRGTMWDDIQDYPERHADNPLQLLLATRLHRRKPCLWRADPGGHWQLVRDNTDRQSRLRLPRTTLWLWDDLQNYPERHADNPLQLLRSERLPRWSSAARSSAEHEWNLLWDNRFWRPRHRRRHRRYIFAFSTGQTPFHRKPAQPPA